MAQALAEIARPGDFFALFGDLGMGKTHFARAFIRHLTRSDLEVPSPTFTLTQYYDAWIGGKTVVLCHADFYRLKQEEELDELGMDGFEGIVLAEWPERMGTKLSAKALQIYFNPGETPDGRQVLLKGDTDWQRRWAIMADRFK